MAARNILLLIADDLGKYVGAYGCPSVQTPHLDQLAAEGTRFDKAFASTASCSGSRSTIYSGLHTHENGQYGLNMSRRHFQTFEHIDTLPKLFNAAGYRTGIVGKVHVGSDDVYPWQVRHENESRDVAWVADRCEEFFESAKADSKSFHLTVGFVDPHRDIATRGRFGNEGPFDARVASWNVRPEDVQVPEWLPDLPETRQELVEYYQAIHRLDQGVGMILAALSRQGLDDSTLVIFTSDNGPPFLNSKTTLYDAGVCLPLMIRHPHESTKNTQNPNLISFIDLLPTQLDFAGLELNYSASKQSTSPPRLGRSLLPILTATTMLPPEAWSNRVFGSHTFHELQNYWPTRYLRTTQYKYHRNIAWRLDFPFASDLYASLTYDGLRQQAAPHLIGQRPLKDYLFRPAEQLFDLENDPNELVNLAEKQPKILLEMRQTLEDWQRETRDIWLQRDGCSLSVLDRYAEDGLEVPDRFDIDAENPAPDAADVPWRSLRANRVGRPLGMMK